WLSLYGAGGRAVLGAWRWAMGDGRWAMGDGRWAMGAGRWAMGDGRWAMGDAGIQQEPDHVKLLLLILALPIAYGRSRLKPYLI
ncbi:hypothetical protein DFP78_110169, partial [Photobacterium lutimaris]